MHCLILKIHAFFFVRHKKVRPLCLCYSIFSIDIIMCIVWQLFFDDSVRNLQTGKKMGLHTVCVSFDLKQRINVLNCFLFFSITSISWLKLK